MLCEILGYGDLTNPGSLLHIPQTVGRVIIFKLWRNSHCNWTVRWKEADF